MCIAVKKLLPFVVMACKNTRAGERRVHLVKTHHGWSGVSLAGVKITNPTHQTVNVHVCETGKKNAEHAGRNKLYAHTCPSG
jgi:hypothetical protein